MDECNVSIAKQRRCKTFCVAGGPNKVSCTNSGDTQGISMHCFPKDPAVRKKWVQFVRRHRTDFDPSKYSSKIFLCSAHFAESCFTKRFAKELTGFDSRGTKCFLARGSVPTIDTAGSSDTDCNETISTKEKRLVNIYIVQILAFYLTDLVFLCFFFISL